MKLQTGKNLKAIQIPHDNASPYKFGNNTDDPQSRLASGNSATIEPGSGNL